MSSILKSLIGFALLLSVSGQGAEVGNEASSVGGHGSGGDNLANAGGGLPPPGQAQEIGDNGSGDVVIVQQGGVGGICCQGLPDICFDIEEEYDCDINAACYWLCDDRTDPPKTPPPTPPPPTNPFCRCNGPARCEEFTTPELCRRNQNLGCSFRCVGQQTEPPTEPGETDEPTDEPTPTDEPEEEDEPAEEEEDEPAEEEEEEEEGATGPPATEEPSTDPDVTIRVVMCDTDSLRTLRFQNQMEQFLGIPDSDRVFFALASENAEDSADLDVTFIILGAEDPAVNPTSFLSELLRQQILEEESDALAEFDQLASICDYSCEMGPCE